MADKTKRPKIIAIANQKGGGGKTTISVNVSACLTMRNLKVLLVDADTQHTGADWYDIKDPEYCDFDIMEFAKGNIDVELRRPEYNEYDYIVIDSRPDVDNFMAKVIRCADIICMPIVTSPADVWSTREMLDLVNRSEESKAGLKGKIIMNSNIQGANLTEKIEYALIEIGAERFETIIDTRVAYRESFGEGRTVIHGTDKKAMAEIEKLTTEILLELK